MPTNISIVIVKSYFAGEIYEDVWRESVILYCRYMTVIYTNVRIERLPVEVAARDDVDWRLGDILPRYLVGCFLFL